MTNVGSVYGRDLVINWYGDGAGNTTEENSSVFSIIRMC